MKTKWKRTLCYLMLAVLGGVINGCGSKVKPQEGLENEGQNRQEDQSQQNTTEIPVGEKEVVGLPEEYGKQIRIIAENRDIWYLDAEYENEDYEYAVTDLDGNGRLEIVISNMGGSGSYSHTYFFEVNEAQDAIVQVQNLAEKGQAQPDLLIDMEKVYIDADGIHHYIVTDYLRFDKDTHYISVGVMSFLEGQISLEYLASRTEVETQKGVKASHKDHAGNEISEDEYYRIVDNYFAGYPEWKVNVEWHNAREIENMNTEELLEQLTDSAREFVFEKVKE